MYMPMLNCKQSELGAIEAIDNSVKSQLFPIFVLRPRSDSKADKPRILAPVPQVDKLMRIFPYPFLVDLSRLDEEGQTAIRSVLANNPKYASVKELIRGVSTRTDYCLIDMATVQTAQLSSESLPRHVVLDFGFVNKDLLGQAVVKATDFIESTQTAVDTYFILGGSIPKVLGVDRKTNWIQERFEKMLYERVVAATSLDKSLVIYADYTVISPALYIGEVQGWGATVQMKYTFPSRYFFARNGLFGGKYSIYDACHDLVSDLEFDADHCATDPWYAQVVAKGLTKGGTPTQWLKHGIQHHLTLCAQEQS